MSTWSEDRRADKLADRTADREDRQADRQFRLQVEEAREKRRREEAVEARRVKIADGKRKRAEKDQLKAARAARRARKLRWLKNHPADIAVAVVMVASIVPAVISQVGALSDADVMMFLAMLLATMLEGASWAMNFMAQAAERAGKPTGKFRVAGWGFAAVASVVNFWHWSTVSPLWVALVFGASSLVAYTVWDLRQHGTNGKTKAERRADKERRAEEKARKEHEAERRKRHKDIARLADDLVAARDYGTLTFDEAFAMAWERERGGRPGTDAEWYAAAVNSKVRLGAAFELGEHVRPELMRTGLVMGTLDPFRARLSNAFPTLGPVSPVPALTGGLEGATSQAGIGLYGPEGASEEGAGKKAETRPVGRSDEELERLLPDAHLAAVELTAEGKPISAAGLAKKLQIRREDAMRLRDWVVSERKEQYGVAAASDGTDRKSVTVRIAK